MLIYIINYSFSRMVTLNAQQPLKDLLILSLYFTFFISCFFFFITSFQTHSQRNITSMSHIAYRILHIVYFEFLLCNVLHNVGNMYWRKFLRGLFLLLFQIISAVTNEFRIPYKLIKRALETQKL